MERRLRGVWVKIVRGGVGAFGEGLGRSMDEHGTTGWRRRGMAQGGGGGAAGLRKYRGGVGVWRVGRENYDTA